MRSKGLQRLRWYCQVCEKQCRDENGFKCHTQSESHVRQMLMVGEDSKKHIQNYSNDFKRDFLQLLRTSHGEKKVNVNHFYQEYIANKEHVHMNSTQWSSLSDFTKWLGREGICRVEETDKGLMISWIDNSPEALRRQDAIRKKERQDKGDEEREQRLIKEQIERAQRDKEGKDANGLESTSDLQRPEGEKIKLNFGAKPAAKLPTPPLSTNDQEGPVEITEAALTATSSPTASSQPPSGKFLPKLDGLGNGKPKNVFSSKGNKNPLAGKKGPVFEQPQKRMSEAERIMKEEMARKKPREPNGFSGLSNKRQKVA